MHLLVTPSFERAVKKLHPQQKSELDEAVRIIAGNPECGEAKVGDLQGIRVYKFRLSNQLCMLAYRILDENSLKLLVFGPYENFYRDLKR
ncbi:MAG: type II toxin-antitoxin system RelE/ParE family toxin [Nitrosomonas sp.]|nr:type II toxin-antitoxin system RelE/ParE family toxin [Nitrosomonas sp.]MCE7917180.1 type II toxin-antitoxin system RelE/ParE family toxin [Nitrosomonas sp. PRO5]MDL1863814.1 type II toxin-antitoxin system RelE/ParE family toxin [Betaproteobacteria bacterium PRO5]